VSAAFLVLGHVLGFGLVRWCAGACGEKKSRQVSGFPMGHGVLACPSRGKTRDLEAKEI